MPEGDTIRRLANRLRPLLEGRTVTRLWLPSFGPVDAVTGLVAREVQSIGKHLLVALGTPGAERIPWVLHVHLGMVGRWRASSPRARPAPGTGNRSLQLETAENAWRCDRPATAELVRGHGLATHPVLTRLGPDLLGPAVSYASILERARRRGGDAAELLLDQRVACGIGNVYKSEVLFLERVSPALPVQALSDDAILDLYRRARTLMQWNLGSGRRTTTRRVDSAHPLAPGETRFWVYGRQGRPCARCGATIRFARRGDAARVTYWCPRCQPSSPERRPGVARRVPGDVADAPR